MRRFTLRLPETLFHRLELLAENEGISLNQFLVYSLTQTAATAFQIVPLQREDVEKQEVRYQTVLERLANIDAGEFDRILAEGEPVAEYEAVDPDLVERVEAKLAAARKKK